MRKSEWTYLERSEKPLSDRLPRSSLKDTHSGQSRGGEVVGILRKLNVIIICRLGW